MKYMYSKYAKKSVVKEKISFKLWLKIILLAIALLGFSWVFAILFFSL